MKKENGPNVSLTYKRFFNKCTHTHSLTHARTHARQRTHTYTHRHRHRDMHWIAQSSLTSPKWPHFHPDITQMTQQTFSIHFTWIQPKGFINNQTHGASVFILYIETDHTLKNVCVLTCMFCCVCLCKNFPWSSLNAELLTLQTAQRSFPQAEHGQVNMNNVLFPFPLSLFPFPLPGFQHTFPGSLHQARELALQLGLFPEDTTTNVFIIMNGLFQTLNRFQDSENKAKSTPKDIFPEVASSENSFI